MLQNLYPHILGFHGLFRWLLVVAALAAIFVAVAGWNGRSAGPLLFRVGLLFVLAMDLELITGILLYLGASPSLRTAFIGHGVIMFLAVLCTHAGGAATRKAPTDALRHRVAAVFWIIALVLMFAGVPRP